LLGNGYIIIGQNALKIKVIRSVISHPDFFPSHNTITIALTKTYKRTLKALESTLSSPLISTITLDEEEPLIAPSNLTFAIESAYLFKPFISNNTSTETQRDIMQIKVKEEK
jgi:hypothetical protein